MNTSSLNDNIFILLNRLVEHIQQANKLNRSHLTVDAENLFCRLLNTAFDWELINANRKKSNQDTFDLKSSNRKLCVQITSNQAYQAKLDRTLKRFDTSNKGFEKIIILFITKELPDSISRQGTAATIEYEVDDISSLYRKIYKQSLSHAKLEEINDEIDAFTRSNTSTSSLSKKIAPPSTLPPIRIAPRKNDLYIDRAELVTQLYDYSIKDNGLIIGGPGVGKSFAIEELQRFCSQYQVPCYIILVNELLAGDDKAIKKALSIGKGEWKETLRTNWLEKPTKAVLIFDGFDTAKDANVVSDVLIQMQKAIKLLSPNWSVLASVRSYDATKSQRLVQLFPQQDITKSVSCRQFEIPELTASELQHYLGLTSVLLSAYERSSAALQRLLLIPYFLVLFTDIVKGTVASLEPLFEVQNEEQLLHVYWQQKIAGNLAADILLEKLTNEILKSQRLSCKRRAIVKETNTQTYESLLSAGILTESAANQQLVFFTHNILLEYAASLYCIPEEAEEAISYIQSNRRQPFTFRQSFIYFYYRLWKVDTPRFWEHYFLIQSQQEPLFKLFHQTVLNYVLGSLYTSPAQLTPIFKQVDTKKKETGIRKLLEGIRFLKKQPFTEIDDKLLHSICGQLSTTYAWELGFLINRSIGELESGKDLHRWNNLFETSRLYLEWVLKERKTESRKGSVDHTGGQWGIGNICRVFQINPSTAFSLIIRVLEILQEEDFPLRFYQELERHVTFIFESDTHCGEVIFKTLYLFREFSPKETYLGSSVLMGLRSNRRQDYEMIHHRLENRFKELIDVNAENAILLGLEIVDETTNFRTLNDKDWSYPLRFNSQSAVMIADFSFFDSELEKEHGPLSLLNDIFKYLTGLLQIGNTERVNELIGRFANAKAARTWRYLLQFIGQHSGQMKKWGIQLVMNESIIVCDETTQAAADMFKRLWSYLSITERETVEKAIIQIQYSTSFPEKHEFLQGRVKRFLGVIPENQMETAEAKAFLELHGISDNRALLHYSGFQPYVETEEEKLTDMGVNREVEAEMTAYRWIEEWQSLRGDFRNENDKIPTPAQLNVFLPIAKKLLHLVQSHPFNDKLASYCDSIVSEIGELASRVGSKLNSDDRALVWEIASNYINNPRYTPTEYEEGTKTERVSSYQESPRIIATKIIVQLLYSDKTEMTATTLKQLFSDNSKIVRLQATYSLNHFYYHRREDWFAIVKERLLIEKDGFCLCEFLKWIAYINIVKDNQSFIEQLVVPVRQRLSIDSEPITGAIWERYSLVIFHLLVVHKSEVAIEIASKNTTHPELGKALSNLFVDCIAPHSEDEPHNIDLSDKNFLLQILKKILEENFKIMQVHDPADEQVSDAYRLLDGVMLRLYHSFEKLDKEKDDTTSVIKKEELYQLIRPLLIFIVNESGGIGSGYIMAHTAYSLMQLLNIMLYFDPADIFLLATQAVNYASSGNFTYDEYTMREVISMTETVLADHKQLVLEADHFQNLLVLLDKFAESGWPEPLELTWRIKEAL